MSRLDIKNFPELDPAAIGARLKELRTGAELSIRKLERDMDITWATLAAWENGERPPSTFGLARYSEYFGVTTDYILFGGEK